MLQQGSKLYSIFHQKCPRCHQGDFYVYKNPFRWKNKLTIHDHCPHCKLKYMIEPSFFYGAMYVSYAVTVAMAVTFFIIGYWIGLDLLYNLIGIVVLLVLSNSFVMRISRLIYINMFVSYDKKYSNY